MMEVKNKDVKKKGRQEMKSHGRTLKQLEIKRNGKVTGISKVYKH